LELYHYPIIIVVGILSGFLNTVAGGGSLITLPILIFMDLPSTVANGTNRVAILAQSTFATAGFRSKGMNLPIPYAYYLAGVSLVGAFLGVRLAVDITDHVFNRILAVIMVVVVLLSVREQARNKSVQEEILSLKSKVAGVLFFFFLGIYGGFLQAGIGFMIIAIVTWLHRFSLVKTNYIKVFVVMLLTVVAVIYFAIEDKIRWEYGIMLAAGQGIGGWYASRWSVEKGEKWIKRILVVSVIGLAIKLWFFQEY
jgi:hypothetical protein